ncbi:uncharacterized protein LOC113343973 [Papaver somniferum]|uniref:uncharacterized protein LOC113343973 n=1 Tax=Papaver somniferum TaxID=3469 RepID=UPI000E7012C8|nr:uncharacterized protein LOC113343973 [Papaver somniferum]
MVNELHIKRKDGNLGLKLDISQAFDNVSWSFVMEVFRQYGFSEDWCSWILNILNSSRISILLNGSPEGYFKINRGLRQGDPLSPLIFVLIEDVLSRNITELFQNRDMTHMVRRNGIAPTHLFFADDIMIFCKGNMKSVTNLVKLLDMYQRASGQCVCREKSKIYFGGGSLNRRQTIADFLGMGITYFPDRYLGVKVMPGAVKYRHISNVVDKLEDQLSVMKVKEGGLGISSLRTMNKVLIMKLWWSIRASDKKWARFLESKFTCRDGRIKVAGVKSFILPGILWVHNDVVNNTKCIIGDGRSTSLFFDVWYGVTTLAEVLNRTDLDRDARFCDIIVQGQWVLQGDHRQDLTNVGVFLEELLRIQGGLDRKVWMPDLRGNFSVKSARELIRTKYPIMVEAILLWRSVVHPSLAAQNWKFVRGACATLDKVRSRFKIALASKCCVCQNDEEFLEHILWNCSFAKKAWNWISGIFNLTPHYNLISSNKAAKGCSRMVKDLLLVSNLVLRSELCALRGNPGVAGDGVVARNVNSEVVGAMCIGLRIVSNYMAELYGIHLGLEWAVQWGYRNILIRTDSSSVITTLEEDNVPWFAQQRWSDAKGLYDTIKFVHTYREANFAAVPEKNEEKKLELLLLNRDDEKEIEELNPRKLKMDIRVCNGGDDVLAVDKNIQRWVGFELEYGDRKMDLVPEMDGNEVVVGLQVVITIPRFELEKIQEVGVTTEN